MALRVDVGPVERVDVKRVAAAAVRAKEAFECARQLVGSGKVDEAVLDLYNNANPHQWQRVQRIESWSVLSLCHSAFGTR